MRGRPAGALFTGGSGDEHLTLRLPNRSGQTITAVNVDWALHYFNNQNRANTWSMEYSTDGVTFASAVGSSFTTPEAADTAPVAWATEALGSSITDITVLDGGFLYLRFVGVDTSSTGGRDKIQIDDIVINATFAGASSFDAGVEVAFDVSTPPELADTLAFFTEGDEVSFVVTARNEGAGALSGLTVSVDLHDGALDALFSADAGTSFDLGTGVWTIPALAPGAFVTLEVTTIAAGDQGGVSQIVTVSMLGHDEDDDDSDNDIAQLGFAIDPASCTASTQCARELCVIEGDALAGVCCDVACGGGAADDCMECVARTVGSNRATCGPLLVPESVTCRPAAGDCDVAEVCEAGSMACPADELVEADEVCRPADGLCDVAEVCDGLSAACPANGFRDDTFVCRSASCTSGTAVEEATCSGSDAACPAEVSTPCAPFLCGADACLVSCATTDDCVGGATCQDVSGSLVCVQQLDDGEACTSGNQCQSGNCVDGLCCDSTCTGQCEACNVTGSEGECVPVTGAPVGGRAACADDGSACGGACDGVETDACVYPGAETVCRAASCTDGFATAEALCGGTGACPAAIVQDCAPFSCGPVACDGDCDEDEDCDAGEYCASGVCTPLRADGEACSTGDVCSSGICTDGVCCDGICDGQCEACNEAGSEGTCVAVSGAPRGGRAACASDGSSCGGTCDGVDATACAYPAAGTTCGAGSCAAGEQTDPSACDGDGACIAGGTTACAPYICGADACLTSCTTDGDCAGAAICFEGACVDDTAECTTDGDCAANEACIDGTCEPVTTPECNQDGDCGAGETCIAGVCTPPAAQCSRDSDCAEGEVCTDGNCVVPVPPIVESGGRNTGCQAVTASPVGGSAALAALLLLLALTSRRRERRRAA